jgi:hypothetical protein
MGSRADKIARGCAECGAKFPKESYGPSGYAVRGTLREIFVCYACADRHERIAMHKTGLAGEKFGCYMRAKNPDQIIGGTVTTWTGGVLGEIAQARETSIPGWPRRSAYWVKVRAFDGSLWHGKGNPGMYLALTPYKKGKG